MYRDFKLYLKTSWFHSDTRSGKYEKIFIQTDHAQYQLREPAEQYRGKYLAFLQKLALLEVVDDFVVAKANWDADISDLIDSVQDSYEWRGYPLNDFNVAALSENTEFLLAQVN